MLFDEFASLKLIFGRTHRKHSYQHNKHCEGSHQILLIRLTSIAGRPSLYPPSSAASLHPPTCRKLVTHLRRPAKLRDPVELPDPVELEVFKNLYHSVAEEMGVALRRTSFSPNIKERRDYSCAVFDSRGQVIAMGDHMPVHLGSMPMSVAAAIEQCALEPGDLVMLNDPFRGGTHLPDITLVMPVHIPCGDGAPPRQGAAKPRHHTTAPDFY